MKKVLLLVGMVFALCSCGEKQPTVDVEKEIEKTVTQNLRKRMKNPDSFVLESIEIEKDTVPYYFNNNIISIAGDLREALDDYTFYADMSDYWYDEKMAALYKVESFGAKLKDAIEVAKYENDKNPMVEYIACLRASAENSFGTPVSSNYICIVDHKDTSHVLCVYDLDTDFIKPLAIIMLYDEDIKARLEKDRFGNYDASKLSFVERFILGN